MIERYISKEDLPMRNSEQSGSMAENQAGGDLLAEAVAYFLEEPGLSRLLSLIAAKYSSLGRWGGSVKITELTPAEREGLTGFLGRDFTGQATVKVSLAAFLEAWQRTKFAAVPVLELLARITGKPVRTQADIRDEQETRRQQYFACLGGQFPQDNCQRWLGAIAAKETGTRGIYLAYEKDPEQLQKHLQAVLKALADLEQRRAGQPEPGQAWEVAQTKTYEASCTGRLERLPLFAGRITQDPHGFDPDTDQGRLLIKALTWLTGQGNEDADRINTELTRPKSPASIGGGCQRAVKSSMDSTNIQWGLNPPLNEVSFNESEALTELYFRFGILRDDILNFVTCAGITAFDEAGTEMAVWLAANRERVILNVPLREAVKIKAAQAATGNKVFMVENSGVFTALIDRLDNEGLPYPALICAHGQFKLASLVLLDRLVAGGMTVYYSGDFDPEGLLMAERLCRRYPGQVVPWHYSVQDYQLARSAVVISQRRLSQLAGLVSPDLKQTGDEICHWQTVGYQEAIIDLLWRDLAMG